MKIQVSFKENGNQIIDILEVGKDCTLQQANRMIKDGKATELNKK